MKFDDISLQFRAKLAERFSIFGCVREFFFFKLNERLLRAVICVQLYEIYFTFKHQFPTT
jgi:hypothetical protein